jgi:putative FmdB family regulatory protein
MPTYEYKCQACGHRFEKFQSITARPIRKCPKCGKNQVKRLISTGAGLIFKGGGFYTTDYRSEAYKNAAKSDAPPTAPAAASADAKTPAASGDAKTAAPKTDAPAKPVPAESKPAIEPKSAKSSGQTK